MNASLKNWLIGLGTLLAMVVGFQIWFRDLTLVVIFVASLALHEVGHYSVVTSAGVPAKIFFIPFFWGGG